MSSAPPPSGRQVELVAGAARAVLVEVGGGLRTLHLDGRDVVPGYPEDAVASGGRGQHLLPWPNRVGDGRWSWEGRDLQLPLTEPAARNANHGLVRWSSWEVGHVTPTSAVLRTVVPPQPGWPGRLDVTCRWELAPDGLTAHLEVLSQAPRPVPLGYGAHPYLAPRTALVDEEELHVPGALRLLTDDRGLPTGQEEVAGTAYDFRTPRAIGDTVLDTCFGDLERDADGRAAVRLGDVEVWGDEAFGWFQVYSGETLPEAERRRSLAVEPMTCPPDALRSGTDLVVLEPGARWSGSWGIRPA
jgi:aldose 1-epimerase